VDLAVAGVLLCSVALGSEGGSHCVVRLRCRGGGRRLFEDILALVGRGGVLDVTWQRRNERIWTAVEVHLGIIYGCVPWLKSFFDLWRTRQERPGTAYA
jgi:hypothetical protein